MQREDISERHQNEHTEEAGDTQEGRLREVLTGVLVRIGRGVMYPGGEGIKAMAEGAGMEVGRVGRETRWRCREGGNERFYSFSYRSLWV